MTPPAKAPDSPEPTRPTPRRDGELFVLDLGDGENRIDMAWIDAVEAALDAALAEEAPRALVTVASGKFFSNGLDLDWLAAHAEELPTFIDRAHGLFARLLTAGIPTVAAVQGHAFAAGAMVALCHDHIVMRADRGYFCLPEINIRIPFTPGMTALLKAKLSPKVAHEAATSGRRYGGPDALAAGIVDAVAAADEVERLAFDWARERAADDPTTLATIKERLHADTLAALRADGQV